MVAKSLYCLLRSKGYKLFNLTYVKTFTSWWAAQTDETDCAQSG